MIKYAEQARTLVAMRAARESTKIVRDWRDEDAARMLDMYSRDDVVRFLGSVPAPMASIEQAHERIARGRRRNAEQSGPCGWWAATWRVISSRPPLTCAGYKPRRCKR